MLETQTKFCGRIILRGLGMLFEDKLLRFLSELDEPVLINVAGQAGSGRSEFLRSRLETPPRGWMVGERCDSKGVLKRSGAPHVDPDHPTAA